MRMPDLARPESDVPHLQALLDRVPVVVVGRRLTLADETPAAHGLATVRTDDAKGIREAVGYLVGLGHRDVAHVDGGAIRARLTGAGLPISDAQSRPFRPHQGHHGCAHRSSRRGRGTHDGLAEGALPTAVLAGNDRCALGLLDVFPEPESMCPNNSR